LLKCVLFSFFTGNKVTTIEPQLRSTLENKMPYFLFSSSKETIPNETSTGSEDSQGQDTQKEHTENLDDEQLRELKIVNEENDKNLDGYESSGSTEV
jgi:hypothetical protein